MLKADNKYTNMQRSFFDANAGKMAQFNHVEHNDNPHYWSLLLGGVENNEFDGKVGLDFGCGCGRNIINLFIKSNWKRVDGVDISSSNIEECRKILEENISDKKYYDLYTNNGVDLGELKSDEYDFIMSTIVFQHIAVHEIRYSLMKEIHRILKDGGVFSFQMGYGNKCPDITVDYYANHYDASGTNSDCDVRIENPEHLIKDLTEIGFNSIKYEITPSWSNIIHDEWIYVTCNK